MIVADIRIGIPFDGTDPEYQMRKVADTLRAMKEAGEGTGATVLIDSLEVMSADTSDRRQKLG